jgi:hypothetical protein
MRHIQPQSRKKNTTIAPPRKRLYHIADDVEFVIEYEAPEWLIGG